MSLLLRSLLLLLLCYYSAEGQFHSYITPLPETYATLLRSPTNTSSHVDLLTNEFKEILEASIRHKECPSFYTKVGEQCVSIFYLVNLPWMESRAFCHAIGGDLFTIKQDLSNFFTLLQHLRKAQITTDFWMGGLYKDESLGWQWVDDTKMKIGSPIWAVRHYDECSTRLLTSPVLNTTQEANSGYCYHYQQDPSTFVVGSCSAITYENYFYVSDENCLAMKSPLCVLSDELPKNPLVER